MYSQCMLEHDGKDLRLEQRMICGNTSPETRKTNTVLKFGTVSSQTFQIYKSFHREDLHAVLWHHSVQAHNEQVLMIFIFDMNLNTSNVNNMEVKALRSLAQYERNTFKRYHAKQWSTLWIWLLVEIRISSFILPLNALGVPCVEIPNRGIGRDDYSTTNIEIS